MCGGIQLSSSIPNAVRISTRCLYIITYVSVVTFQVPLPEGRVTPDAGAVKRPRSDGGSGNSFQQFANGSTERQRKAPNCLQSW